MRHWRKAVTVVPRVGHLVSHVRMQAQRDAGMNRRRLVGLLLTVATGASLALVSVSVGPAAAATPTVIPVPTTTIPADCSVDVGDMNWNSPNGNGLLYNWLQTLPAGTATNPIVVRFQPGGCYLVNGGIYVRNFRHYVFDGNGATFEQVTVPPSGHPVLKNANPSAPVYCSKPGTSYGHDNSYNNTYPIIWWFEGGCDLTVENMTIVGPNSSGGGGPNQQNSGVQLNGVERAVVTNMNVRNVDGDFVTVSGLHEGLGGGGGEPATDVTIANNTFNRSGRQGVTTEYVNRVLVTNNVLANVPATVFDIESDVTAGHSDNIDIDNNTVANQSYAYLVAAYTGSTIDNLAFTNNHLNNGGQMRIVVDANGLNNATITGNVATGVNSARAFGMPAVAFNDGSSPVSESNILVAGNTIPSSPWNHDQPIRGVATVTGGALVNNLQVQNNYMPLTYGNGVPTTYHQVLPLKNGGDPPIMHGNPQNGACGNTQGSDGTIYYGSACTVATAAPTLPVAPALPDTFPSTTVTSPSSGTALTGTQALEASASSGFGVTNVEFHLTGGSFNSAVIATATPNLGGYGASWDTTTVPDGTYTLQSVAYDAAGDSNSSASVTVTVDNTSQPFTSVLVPSSGTALTGTQALEASASSGFGVANVEFHLTGGSFNNALIATATPNLGGYGASWDTTTVPDGTYTLQSVAYDAAGNSAPSAGVAITVDNNPPPVTSVVIPSIGAVLAGTQWLDASATSTFGVSAVEYHLTGGSFNNALIATATATMYGYLASWDTTTVPDGTYTLQSVAYDTAGNSTESAGITVVVNN